MCMGFWVGMLLFFLNGFTELFTFELTIGNMFICGWLIIWYFVYFIDVI